MIEFDAPFGDQIKKVKISQPFGTGGEQYHLLIDGYFKGSLTKLNGEWVFHSNKPDQDITAAEISVLGELIEKNKAKL